MTKDDVTRLAREAGWPDSMVHPIIMAKLAEFAELIANKYEQKIEDLENQVIELQERQE